MREASKRRTATDTDSCAFLFNTRRIGETYGNYHNYNLTMKNAVSRFFFITFLALALSCLMSGCSNTNDYEVYGAIHGCVTNYETGAPLDNATITLSPSGLSKQTDAAGYFEFKNLEPMQYTLTVQKQGYQPNRKTVTTMSGEDFQTDVQLKPIPEN